MMDFIMVPAILGIIIWGVYSIFELFARKKERLALIEKMGNGALQGNSLASGKIECTSKFSALKWGGLLIGIGLGLLIGFLIDTYVGHGLDRHMGSVIYGAPVLLCGGLALVAVFLIEYKLRKKEEE